jgi:hypothetical protein
LGSSDAGIAISDVSILDVEDAGLLVEDEKNARVGIADAVDAN